MFGQTVNVDSSGNVYISGGSWQHFTGGRNVLIAKYNYLGQILWQRTLGSSLQNFTDEVAGGYIGIDGSGNVYGTATSNTLLKKQQVTQVLQKQDLLDWLTPDLLKL